MEVKDDPQQLKVIERRMTFEFVLHLTECILIIFE